MRRKLQRVESLRAQVGDAPEDAERKLERLVATLSARGGVESERVKANTYRISGKEMVVELRPNDQVVVRKGAGWVSLERHIGDLVKSGALGQTAQFGRTLTASSASAGTMSRVPSVRNVSAANGPASYGGKR